MNRFKVGDKVKILPLATGIMVAEDEVGKTGVIIRYHSSMEIIVYMDKIRKASRGRVSWCVTSLMIEPVIKIGQQLLFDFMR